MNLTALHFPIENIQLRDEYAQLIPKIYHSCLEGRDPFGLKSPVIGAGATLDGHGIGVVLATAHTKIHIAYIHCLAIKDPFADENLVFSLLQMITQLLIEKGITFATFIYSPEDAISAILEKIFPQNQWQGPQPFSVECLFNAKEFDPPWWYKNIELEQGVEEFLFKNLTKEEQKNLWHRHEQLSIPAFIFPFGHEKNLIEYKNSLGLRYKGKVVGWMITHRIEPDRIRYSLLYLEKDFAHTRYWLKLLIDSLRIHRNKIPRATYGLLEINLKQISQRWLKFIEKRLFPHALKITHKNVFWKNF